MSRPGYTEAQREDIYLNFLDEGMTKKEAEEATEKKMQEMETNE